MLKQRLGFLQSLSPWSVCFILFWSTFSNLAWSVVVAITFEKSFYILPFDRDAYNALNGKVGEGEVADGEVVEEAFEVVVEGSEG